MDLQTTERIEAAIDGTAAMLFAGAAAFAAMRAAESPPATLAAAGVAFVTVFLMLRTIRPSEQEFAVTEFDLQAVAVGEADELILCELHRVAARVTDELVLDDVLADPEPDSRVVKLFDPSAMPIDLPDAGGDPRFAGASAVPTPPDASQALHEALAKLRHSLR
jgi:hypothetical protein